MTIGGTLPRRKPGTLICWAIFLYAASRLGLSSSKGTSTVSLARVGLKVSTALFTGCLLRSQDVSGMARGMVRVGATGLEPAISCSQSRRASHYATPRQDGPRISPGGRGIPLMSGKALPDRSGISLTCFALERMTGIEPAYSVWKTEALPLSYIRAPFVRVSWCHTAARRSQSGSAPVHQQQGPVVAPGAHRVDEPAGA